MIDIHTHILPGVDDGADGMGQAVKMIQMASMRGTKQLILTPHLAPAYGYYNFDLEHLDQRFQELCQIVYEQEGLPVVLHPGMEVLYEGRSEMYYYKDQYFTLCGSPYLLMEFYFDCMPEVFLEGIDTALECGFVPIVAHPERYGCVEDIPELVLEGRRRGAFFQANKSSFSGLHGTGTAKTVQRLMARELIDFIASDAHDTYRRTPGLDRIRRYIRSEYGSERAFDLFEGNARKITAYGEQSSPVNERVHT